MSMRMADLDLVTDGRLYLNTLSNNNHWFKISLVGDGTNVNKTEIGTQVRIPVANGRILTRQVEGGTGEGNQNELRLHFGLGSYNSTLELEIVWPDGTVDCVDASPDTSIEIAY
jgi:hypothetical protein